MPETKKSPQYLFLLVVCGLQSCSKYRMVPTEDVTDPPDIADLKQLPSWEGSRSELTIDCFDTLRSALLLAARVLL